MNAAMRVGLIVIAPFFAVCALSEPSLPLSLSRCPTSIVATDFHDDAATQSEASVMVTARAVDAEKVEEWDAKGSPDFYGNEVVDAVARYKLDDEGSLYELHSPQTELPRLASPKG